MTPEREQQSAPYMKAGYVVSPEPNPHLRRARQIMRAHPEVTKYFRVYPTSALYIAAVAGFQLVMAWMLRDARWFTVLGASWLIGAVAAHALFVLLHDAVHDRIVESKAGNKFFGILTNVGQAVPSAASFRIFHLLHHSHLDEYDFDGDLAFESEGKWVGDSPIRKCLWFLAFPIIQMFRPMRIDRPFFDGWVLANVLIIAAVDVAVFAYAGWNGIAYLLLSMLFGTGLHPLGARWVQEHYNYRPGQETYSYYGPANWVAFNIGYHNEHHDLVAVPWVDLPKVKALAPEFYEDLYAHRSYSGLFLRFVFDRRMTLFSRVTRDRDYSGLVDAGPVRDAA